MLALNVLEMLKYDVCSVWLLGVQRMNFSANKLFGAVREFTICVSSLVNVPS